MDSLQSLKIFCQVVQSGSFTRAAEQLNLSTSMVSKHIAKLEQDLSIRLLYRSNRQLSLTEQGERYYQDCQAALSLLSAAAERAREGSMVPEGVLRVSMPVWFACSYVAELLQRYQARYPEVRLDLTLTNRNVDLDNDGIDLAFRLSHQLAEHLIAKKIADIPFRLVASPDYLDHALPIDTPEALIQHHGLMPSYTDLSALRLRDQEGREHEIALPQTTRSNNTLMLYQLARAGMGVAYLPLWLIEADLAAGRLVLVCPEYLAAAVPFYAVYTRREFVSVKVRSLIDFMAAAH